ncbi:MAG TPA: hypothetical protein VGE14_15850 [Marmoricola sp.]
MSTLIAATPAGLLGRWSARSQEGACRNARAACTDLAARRAERLDVERFVAEHLAERRAERGAAHPAEPRALLAETAAG